MEGSGYEYIAIFLFVVAVAVVVTLVVGLIYARRTLGPPRDTELGYPGWYAFYTVRFMVRIVVGIWLVKWAFAADFYVALVAAAFVLFPRLWWRALSSLIRRDVRPVLPPLARAPLSKPEPETRSAGRWTRRTRLFARAALPWPAGLSIIYALFLSGGSYLPSLNDPDHYVMILMVVSASVMTATAAITWFLSWRRERILNDLPGRLTIPTLAVLAVVTGWIWLRDLAVVGHNSRVWRPLESFGFLDMGLTGDGLWLVLMLGHLAMLGLLVLGARLLPDVPPTPNGPGSSMADRARGDWSRTR